MQKDLAFHIEEAGFRANPHRILPEVMAWLTWPAGQEMPPVAGVHLIIYFTISQDFRLSYRLEELNRRVLMEGIYMGEDLRECSVMAVKLMEMLKDIRMF